MKQYLMSMNRKDAKEIHTKMFPNGEGEFTKLPRPGREQVINPAIASGQLNFGIENTGDNVFNLYQYIN